MVRISARAVGVLGRAATRATAVALVAVGAGVALATPAEAVATRTVAFYSMDEAPGSTVLVDSSGNGRNGTIGADVTTGVVVQGATAQRFATHLPSDGYFPGHVDRVPPTSDFNPDAGDFSIEIRLRTTYSFGNIMQKGQGTQAGGYWKLENPGGLPRCLFRGGNGASRTGYSTVPITDGQWHTIRCNRTSTYVEMWVDGVRQSRLNGSTGTISNTSSLSIGGKGSCDGVSVTCDYFVGDVDYARIEKGSGGAPNSPPVASISTDCVGLVCALSGAGSTDADGAVQRYVWEFGDGATLDAASVPTTSHTYAAAGTYTVRLSVTDDRGATTSTTRAVSVAPVPEVISFVDQATSNVNATTHTVVVPSSVQAGDALLLFVSQNSQSTITGPTGVGGWTQLDSIAGGDGRTTAWSTIAGPGAAGTPLTVTFSGYTKANVVLAAYRGADPANPVSAVAAAGDAVSSAVRVTPTAPVAHPRSWAVSYWMHGDATTSALVPPAGVAVRSNGSQTGGGRVTGMLADSAASVPTAPYGGKAATAAAASTTTTTWTVILQPASAPPPPNEPPVASFSVLCQDLACTLDGTSSSDAEGPVASFHWELGDGAAADGPTADHTFAAAGTYTAELTVTDGAGQTASTTHEVTVSGPVAQPSDVTFVGAAAVGATASTHTVTVPASVLPGDTVLLFLALASPVAITDPAGWQTLGTVDDSSLRTRVWSRVATAGDAGSTVAVPVGSSVKGTLTVVGYRGVGSVPVATGQSAPGDSAARTTPVAPVETGGSWAVSYWAHRDSSTAALTPPAGVATRAAASQTGGGRVTALLADSDGTVPTGSYGGLVATAEAASSYGVAWTVVLAP